MGKILLSTILLLILSITVLPIPVLPIPAVTQTNPKTTIYLNPPIINGTEIGVNKTFIINLMIRDAVNMSGWQAGMLFNATLLRCVSFSEGPFFSDEGTTIWQSGTIDNTAGVITAHACILTGELASGNGTLAYLTFKVKAPGISNIHLRDTITSRQGVPLTFNIIDAYTVVLNATSHTVVTLSNSIGLTGLYHSGFYAHAYNPAFKTLSFNVTGPEPGFSNITIPKTLLPAPEPPRVWAVVIDGTLLSTGQRIVTENATHTFVYFTYSKGFNVVEITTRMSSTISMALSSDSIDLGSNVTISGNITREDYTGRPNVNVTIQSRQVGAVTWDTVDTVETDSNSDYISAWAPGATGIYEVMASWEGDNETFGYKSDVQTLTVMENSTISIALSSANITFGSGVTISGEIDPLKPNVLVTSQYKLIGEAFWTSAGQNQTDQDSKYTYTWTPEKAGTYEVRAMWLGDDTTYGATSNVLTLTVLKITSTISITLSSTNITLGENVTISGTIDPAQPSVTVTIQYRLNGGEWISLANATTDANSNYTYTWTPEKAGTYEVKASWEGDENTEGDESDMETLTVKKATEGIPLEIVIVLVAAIVVIAAIAVYFLKVRKPKTE